MIAKRLMSSRLPTRNGLPSIIDNQVNKKIEIHGQGKYLRWLCFSPHLKQQLTRKYPLRLSYQQFNKLNDASKQLKATTLINQAINKIVSNKYLTRVQIKSTDDIVPITNLTTKHLKLLNFALKRLIHLRMIDLQNINIKTNQELSETLYNICHLGHSQLQHISLKLARSKSSQNLINNLQIVPPLPDSAIVNFYIQYSCLPLTSLFLNITTNSDIINYRTFSFRHLQNPKTKLYEVTITYPASNLDQTEIIEPILATLVQLGSQISNITLIRMKNKSCFTTPNGKGDKLYDMPFPHEQFPNLKSLTLYNLKFKEATTSDYQQSAFSRQEETIKPKDNNNNNKEKNLP